MPVTQRFATEPHLPQEVWNHIFSYLPEATIARLPGGEPLYRDTLRRVFGFADDADMGPAPRRTLAAVCGLVHARRLTVTEIPMPRPPPPPPHGATAGGSAGTSTDTPGRGPNISRWAPLRALGPEALSAWRTKVGFVVVDTVLRARDPRHADAHTRVAVLDVVTQCWQFFCDVRAETIVLGPEGVFASGDGRLSLTSWGGARVWEVEWPLWLRQLALGHGLIGAAPINGMAPCWWDRATGAYIGCARMLPGNVALQQFVRVHDGFAGGTDDGRILVWDDGHLQELPRVLRENACDLSCRSNDGPAFVRALCAGAQGIASADSPAGLCWRPTLGAPAAQRQIWANTCVVAKSLQQVGRALLWVDGAAESCPGMAPLVHDTDMMRSRLGERESDIVARLPKTAFTSAMCLGAYYTFRRDRPGLLRIAAAQQ